MYRLSVPRPPVIQPSYLKEYYQPVLSVFIGGGAIEGGVCPGEYTMYIHQKVEPPVEPTPCRSPHANLGK